jgi:hypothetical protein
MFVILPLLFVLVLSPSTTYSSDSDIGVTVAPDEGRFFPFPSNFLDDHLGRRSPRQQQPLPKQLRTESRHEGIMAAATTTTTGRRGTTDLLTPSGTLNSSLLDAGAGGRSCYRLSVFPLSTLYSSSSRPRSFSWPRFEITQSETSFR